MSDLNPKVDCTNSEGSRAGSQGMPRTVGTPPAKETYQQPLLTRHKPLLDLTGSGVKKDIV